LPWKTSELHQQKTSFLLSIKGNPFWAANHSAVHVSMGEADELAALFIAVFAVNNLRIASV
jgi:hypothetical protein